MTLANLRLTILGGFGLFAVVVIVDSFRFAILALSTGQ